MIDKMKLYTSLPPKITRSIVGTEVGTLYIAECIKSWIRGNFEVISLNNVEEIRELIPLGYGVEYLEVAADRPRINNFLDAIRSSGCPVAGIINSDVFLSHDPGLLGAIAHLGAGEMAIIERVNIDPVSLRPTGRSCYGFDALFFSTDLLSRIDLDCEFSFGQPWWDYWFPLAYASVGGRLMTIDAALLFHLDHPQKWNQAQWVTNAEKTIRYFMRSTGQLPNDFVAEIQRLSRATSISEIQLGPFAEWCFAKLRSMSEPIALPPRMGGGELLRAFLAALDNREVRALVRKLNEVQASIGVWKEEIRLKEVEVAQVSARLKETEVAQTILSSRKATLLHFLKLNAAWVGRSYPALARSMKPARDALRRLSS